MKQFDVTGHEPSLLPEGAKWKLVWSDEFDGTTLDRTKWDYRMSMMQKVHPAWTDKGVYLDGKSNAVFTLLEEDGRPVSSQLQTGYNFMDEPVKQTKFGGDHLQWPIGKLKENLYTHTFGYYECRCRLQQKPGWWSAFWMQSPVIGASLDAAYTGAEIDIMECFEKGKVVAHNAFVGGYGQDMKNLHAGGMDNLDDGFHRFGVLWEETGYTFYIDGVENGRIDGHVSHCPEFILISTEVKGYRHESHEPVKEAYESLGDTFLVDYVRVFDRMDP
ncbi:MAG TPA: glycoside hydrolase family 16 protein [Candidatus Eisenbergiella merdipullorum]|uniref:Glycoside hydrolase family 16 protein n=1 Tax=Candidatus Eisenbergiella merdipullorum TaxID=2838553 RepID=A0A9D2I626_9FIRM|nr:glycoside hydrolase family 16 protein [Candidatus Eisenbergiella merdipullorum]